MNFDGYPAFGFDIEKVERYAETRFSAADRIEYINLVSDTIELAKKIGYEISADSQHFFSEIKEGIIEESKRLDRLRENAKQGQGEFDGYPVFGFSVDEINEHRMTSVNGVEELAIWMIDALQYTLFAQTKNVVVSQGFVDRLKEINLQVKSSLMLERELKLDATLTELEAEDFDTSGNEESSQEVSKSIMGQLPEVLKVVVEKNNKENLKESAKKETRQIERIQWQGTEAQLVYLFEKLYKKKLLPRNVNDKRYAFIEEHFLNNKGQEFKRRQLAQTSQNFQNNKEGKPKGAELIDKLIEEIEPHR